MLSQNYASETVTVTLPPSLLSPADALDLDVVAVRNASHLTLRVANVGANVRAAAVHPTLYLSVWGFELCGVGNCAET
jgi:hypothetical protein